MSSEIQISKFKPRLVKVSDGQSFSKSSLNDEAVISSVYTKFLKLDRGLRDFDINCFGCIFVCNFKMRRVSVISDRS